MPRYDDHKHLHYMVCLGSRLRTACSDILGDALPEAIRVRLDKLSRCGRGDDDAGHAPCLGPRP